MGNTRRLIYVAHPFTGSEKRNIEKATQIIKRLQHSNPSETFISPLLAFGHLQGQIDYNQAMILCLSLLSRCDLLLLTGAWWQSNGCKIEKFHAESKDIEVIDTTVPKPYNFQPPSRKETEGLIF